jgi:hypothetical protein
VRSQANAAWADLADLADFIGVDQPDLPDPRSFFVDRQEHDKEKPNVT